tara:strand:- start:403 stop:531 length:129 start_codon:yes stop_codon:yes gene_type:complete
MGEPEKTPRAKAKSSLKETNDQEAAMLPTTDVYTIKNTRTDA